jgi:4-hydroxy-tetrahydrodipicolinate synthase
MTKLRLEGIFVPHVTPFKRRGSLDLEALRTLVKFWVENGVSGLVPCGSNGEAPYLSRQERKKVIGTVVDEANGKVLVVAGTGSMSTRETVQFTKDARDLGVDGALVVTPFYFRLSNREIHEHYRTLMNAVDLPIVIYNIPRFTGFSIEPNVISQLASENENVVGVKDSSGNVDTITEIIRLVGTKISVLAGATDVTLPALKQGGTGAVLAVANVFPELCNSLYKAFKKGEQKRAAELQERLSFVNEVLVKKHNQLSAIKEALRQRELPGGYPRKPALPLESDERKNVQELLRTVEEPS